LVLVSRADTLNVNCINHTRETVPHKLLAHGNNLKAGHVLKPTNSISTFDPNKTSKEIALVS
jgi:hypothetical protein